MAPKKESFIQSQRRKLAEQRASNRIRVILKRLKGIEDPDLLMREIMQVLTDTTDSYNITPGTYCTFIYRAKTPQLVYDLNPLVAVTGVYEWGFTGINFHWAEPRKYTHAEVMSQIHIVRNEEIRDLRTIPYQKYLINT